MHKCGENMLTVVLNKNEEINVLRGFPWVYNNEINSFKGDIVNGDVVKVVTYDNKFGDAKEYGLRDIPEARNVYKDIVLDDIPNDPYGVNDEVPDMTIRAKVILKGQFSENIDGSSIIEWKIS